MDRIDLHLNVPAVDINKLMIDSHDNCGEKSIIIKERVTKARLIQKIRFESVANVHCNADMKNSHLKLFANLTDSANIFLKQAVTKFNLSARTYYRLIKVSRTIADLDSSETINNEHVAEALQFRIRDG
jgi:magnesium chelatase family protein